MIKILCVLLFATATQTLTPSNKIRERRWKNLRNDNLTQGVVPKQYLIVPSKTFCNVSGGEFGSPVALGGLIGVHRRKDETRESAMQRKGVADEEDGSIFHPQNQTLRFNSKYIKNRDLIFYQNDGEKFTFQFYGEDTSDATVRGENWDDEYVFAKGQFQWCSNFHTKIGGAGHSINNKLYPVEMELIHYKKSEKSLENAWDKDNGVLIISIMFKLVSKGVPALTPLLRNIPYVSQPGPIKLLHAPVAFKMLFPLDDSYFEYIGSYTFSPCYKNIKRIVFETPIEIDNDQMNNFKYLIYEDKSLMFNNFGLLQPLNRRKVNYYKRGYTFSTRSKLKKKEMKSHKHGPIQRRKIVESGS